MFTLCHHFKILRSVVKEVTVNMMNDFTAHQWTTEHLFRNHSMHVATEQLSVSLSFSTPRLYVM